jgi:RimJ/RimL family protein N-acetyltransferase
MISYPEYKPILLIPDIPDYAREWRNRPEIWKWCRQNSLIDSLNHERWLIEQAQDKTIKMFGIMSREEEVGVCGFTSIDMLNRNAEFSLYISPSKQRKGYGKRALQTLLRHGFEDWGFNRIWGETFDGNPAMRTFVDLGMTCEGTLRQNYFRKGKFVNSFIVSILAREFKIPTTPTLDIV